MLHKGLELVNDSALYDSKQAEVILVRRIKDRKVLVLKIFRQANYRFYKNELSALKLIKAKGLHKEGFP